jgi:hypothetical protein
MIKGQIYFGAESGNIYATTLSVQTDAVPLTRISESSHQKIIDIAAISENEFYFLTEKDVFSSGYEKNGIKKIMSNSERHTNMLCANGSIILWSLNTKKPIIFLESENSTPKRVFTPENSITLVRAFDSNIIIIEGNTTVSMYSTQTEKATQLYIGTGVQDALLRNQNELIIAKTVASNPPTPLIVVDIITKESVRLSLAGDIAFSLSTTEPAKQAVGTVSTTAAQNNRIYGITLTATSSSRKTTLFSFNPLNQSMLTLLNYADEDVNAFTYLYDSLLYTNIGKTNVIAYNVQTKAQLTLDRPASLTKKIMRNQKYVAALGQDGGIAWYKNASQRIDSLWYLKTDGQWDLPQGFVPPTSTPAVSETIAQEQSTLEPLTGETPGEDAPLEQ